MARALTSATFLVILGCYTVFSQAPERLQRCPPMSTLARKARQTQQQQPESPAPKTIRFKSIHLNSSEPLAISEQQILTELQASSAIDDRAAWPQDALAAVQQIFQHHGYFRAVLDHGFMETVTHRKQEETVNLTAEVKPGKQYRLDRIVFANATQFDDRQLREFFPIEQGDIFDTSKIGRGIEALRNAYGERGFIDFAAVPSTTQDEARSTIVLKIEVDEGRQFRIGKFELVGLDTTLAETLVANSGLTPGSIFNTRWLDLFFERNKSLLPPGAAAENDSIRKLDEQRGIVDLTIDFRGCAIAPQ